MPTTFPSGCPQRGHIFKLKSSIFIIITVFFKIILEGHLFKTAEIVLTPDPPTIFTQQNVCE